jgi:hypothetical protein
VTDREQTPGTDSDVDKPTPEPTEEVGGEGGGFGNVEIGIDRAAGTGSEAGETWRPVEENAVEVTRDETGQGRRNP